MSTTPQQQLRAYVGYLRDLGIYDLYRHDDPRTLLPSSLREQLLAPPAAAPASTSARSPAPIAASQARVPALEADNATSTCTAARNAKSSVASRRLL